jgi:putative ABC transport system substrate-binding protein
MIDKTGSQEDAFKIMKRRDFITLVGGALGSAATAPLFSGGAAAQPKVIRRVGFLGGSSIITPQTDSYRAFLSQMDELGFRAGRNIIIEYNGLTDPRGPAGSVGDLLRSKPDVVVVTGPEIALQAMLAQSKNTPVVFLSLNYDPVAQKHIASLDKPGGNITGIFVRPSDIAQKQIELLTETLPDRRRLAIAWDNETADQFAAIERAAKEAKLDVLPLRHEKPPYSVDLTFRNIQVRKAQMAIFLPSPHFAGRRSRIAELAIKRKVPTLFGSKAYVESGGLMSLGPDYPAALRKLAEITAKLLRGEKPATIPVETDVGVDIAVNIKTAQAIGVEFPEAVLKRANHKIDH